MSKKQKVVNVTVNFVDVKDRSKTRPNKQTGKDKDNFDTNFTKIIFAHSLDNGRKNPGVCRFLDTIGNNLPSGCVIESFSLTEHKFNPLDCYAVGAFAQKMGRVQLYLSSSARSRVYTTTSYKEAIKEMHDMFKAFTPIIKSVRSLAESDRTIDIASKHPYKAKFDAWTRNNTALPIRRLTTLHTVNSEEVRCVWRYSQEKGKGKECLMLDTINGISWLKFTYEEMLFVVGNCAHHEPCVLVPQDKHGYACAATRINPKRMGR